MNITTLDFLKEFLGENFLGNTENTKNIRNLIVKKNDLLIIEKIVIAINGECQ